MIKSFNRQEWVNYRFLCIEDTKFTDISEILKVGTHIQSQITLNAKKTNEMTANSAQKTTWLVETSGLDLLS